MRKAKSKNENEKADPDLLEHVERLGLKSVADYVQWCERNGFSRKLKKHWKQRCRELYRAQQAVAKGRLGQIKREKRKLNEVLIDICSGKLTQADVTLPFLKRLCDVLRPRHQVGYEPAVNRKSLRRLLARLHECRAKLFDGSPVMQQFGDQTGNTYIEALALIAAHSSSWQRSLSDWRPRSHNSRRQFASLVRHLFVKYDDVPAFFEAVWFAGLSKKAAEQRSWYLHVGRGKNIRDCRLPVAFTKKMAHWFMRAPDGLTIEQALRWGQILGLGGDERLARATFGTRLTQGFLHDEFWSSVLRWFIAHPMLDRAHVGPIVDYLYNQRFVPEFVNAGPGQREEASPPQSNLTMKGRTPAAVLQRVSEWHRFLASDNCHQVQQWEPHGIGGLEFVEGSEKGENLKVWTIRELLSSRSLMTEGRQLKHCVATYASSCAQGRCSIWTMELETLAGRTKLLTIEVMKGTQLICQIRGKANRLANDNEKRVIGRWADSVGLRIAKFA